MTNKTPSLPFDDYPAFYETDNRQKRGFNPVSKAFLEAKFSTLLPPPSVQGKTVLDLGSCYGAAGQWVLFYGATHYTGVEVQANYVKQSRQLLCHWQARAQIVQQDVRHFLQQMADQSVDLVVLAGILY
ncbi:MAG TPA: class I SAM-dependent methyltransferase, partial [Thiomicrospira sp.]|nr:class I SAM-dependent methyltransferase [Thiomicrospira sp.]